MVGAGGGAHAQNAPDVQKHHRHRALCLHAHVQHRPRRAGEYLREGLPRPGLGEDVAVSPDILLQEKVKDKILIVPRIYTNKPRTNGSGYKGMLHQPDPSKKPDMLEGIIAIRRLHTRAVQETGFACADEMLYPENYRYLSDILGYVAVGARSVENQQHRLVASGIDVPVGMKNPTGGDLSVMMNSIYAAMGDHTFLYRGWEVETAGNPYAHAIMRGYVNEKGDSRPNYHYEDLMQLHKLYAEKGIKNPACIVDCNHANSGKQYLEQIRIAKEVLHSKRHSNDINALVKGLMIESYICLLYTSDAADD